MTRILRAETAFSTERPQRQRQPRREDRDHLAFIRGLPCAICGSRNDVQAAHVRARSTQFRKRQSGLSEKPHDKWAVPLCGPHHLNGTDAQHRSNELQWWIRQGIDPFVLALALYGCAGDQEEAEALIVAARKAPK